MNAYSYTVEDRFEAAVRELKFARGVQLYFNVMACCRGCVNIKEIDGETEWAYHFGGQGSEILFDEDGDAYYQEEGEEWEEEDEDGEIVIEEEEGERNYDNVIAFFNHGSDAGEVLKEVFEEFDFIVKWNGTENECVQVSLS